MIAVCASGIHWVLGSEIALVAALLNLKYIRVSCRYLDLAWRVHRHIRHHIWWKCLNHNCRSLLLNNRHRRRMNHCTLHNRSSVLYNRQLLLVLSNLVNLYIVVEMRLLVILILKLGAVLWWYRHHLSHLIRLSFRLFLWLQWSFILITIVLIQMGFQVFRRFVFKSSILGELIVWLLLVHFCFNVELIFSY